MDTSMLPFGKPPPKRKARIKPYAGQDNTGITEPIALPEPLYQCYKTGATVNLHKHHVFGGSKRKWSEKYKLYIYLIPKYHNMSDEGIHFDKVFREQVQEEYQLKFEALNGHECFMRIFGRNYVRGRVA